ncbi:expressed unknown protein [Seminavis robusta]|uniref:Uncharacterized protein n=1 Tax=Seminavis robusta TaxID=568900 RepID=A0A9N8ED05_9STRA|nr:expressed unknown protein [Seminavis robusta]|eukprot:Sro898_g217680.1 n/a (328) ;mRNA; f:40310-41293
MPSISNSSTVVPLKITVGLGDNEPSKVDLSGGPCCCGRVTSELRHRAFDATEVNGPTLHGPATFAPAGRWTMLGKTIITVWSASSLVDGILAAEPKLFYLAYLTHWSLMVTILYMTLSWMLTFRATVLAKAEEATATDVTMLHKIVWCLFTVAAPAEIVVAIGYWGLEWDGSAAGFYYRNFMVHGVVLGLLLLDGLLLNKIPLRIRHIGLILGYLFLYLIWTFIHAYLGIGNPQTPEDDDTIYTALQWRQDPLSTAVVAGQFLLLLAPIAFCTVYGLSLYSFPCGCNGQSRRYLSNTNTSNNTDKDASTTKSSASYVEMGAFDMASV